VYRIGELARRSGVTPDLLRAWEKRYGLLRPARTEGGFRLYGEEDAARVSRMQAGLAAGLSAAESARAALVEETHDDDLLDALLAFDDERAHVLLDGLMGRLTEESVLAQHVLPVLRELGERWARGEVSIAQEHFASNLIRGRVLALARRWDQGVGPRALLACVPGELHDLPLIVFGLALHRRGWRILFLGSDTPFDVTTATAVAQRPDLVVLASAQVRSDLAAVAPLAALAAAAPLALAGRWPAVEVDAIRLEGDPVAAAATVAST
jgi:DNA-binding transcriptional MerR regulator